VPGGAVQAGFEKKSEFKWFKTFSNCFKLWSIRKVLSLAQKIEIKYGFESLEEGNNFLYRKFLRFGMDLELKFREFCMSQKQGKNHWINLGLWNLMTFG
jgi:hypothetical protein